MWQNFFREGGFGMYPTMIAGFLLVASGVLLALRPERRLVPLVVCLGVFTLSSGTLSTAVGIIKSFHYLGQVSPADRLTIGTLGCAESLNNTVLALILLGLTSLLALIAALRAGRAA